jgi:hypothetical protein
MFERRAVEAVIWGMPVVNYDLMRQEMLNKTNGKVNQIVYWGRPLDWHNQTLTPNPDTLYLMAFYNTKEAGPIVIEVPPGDENGSLNCNIVTTWQMPLEDAGLLGADKGSGGAPKGKESNWIPTDPKRGFEAMFRAYAPTKALFEKKWVLPDIEKTNRDVSGGAAKRSK